MAIHEASEEKLRGELIRKIEELNEALRELPYNVGTFMRLDVRPVNGDGGNPFRSEKETLPSRARPEYVRDESRVKGPSPEESEASTRPDLPGPETRSEAAIPLRSRSFFKPPCA